MNTHSEAERETGSGRERTGRRFRNALFLTLCLVTAGSSLAILGVLLTAIFQQGLPGFEAGFLQRPPHPSPSEAGIRPAMFGTLWVCVVCGLVAVPMGVGTAILLEEFQPRNWPARKFSAFVQLNITNLAGVPSVVYGILGLTAFVSMFGGFGTTANPWLEFGVQYFDQYLTEEDEVVLLPAASATSAPLPLRDGSTVRTARGESRNLRVIPASGPLPAGSPADTVTLREDAEGGRISQKAWYYVRLPLGRGVLAGGLTLMLVVLPVVIIASQEALRGVPSTLREGAAGLGATPWQTVWNVTLPAALPGIMTGTILAMSRAIGEAAPILMVAGVVYLAAAPGHLMDDFTVMPLQIYDWAGRPQKEFHVVAARGIIVLLCILLVVNSVAIALRQRSSREPT